MSQWRPCKRNGLYSGAKHQFMVYENHRLTIPSNREYSAPQLRMMIREVKRIINREIPMDEWESLS